MSHPSVDPAGPAAPPGAAAPPSEQPAASAAEPAAPPSEQPAASAAEPAAAPAASAAAPPSAPAASTAVAPAGWVRPRTPWELLRPVRLPLGLAAALFAVYTVFSALQWQQRDVRSWDLGIFTQLAQRYAAFSEPIVHIKGDGYNLLGDHFHPILVLLGPVYALFPSAFALLVVQNLLFAVSAFVIARAAIALTGTLKGSLIGVAYGLSWGLQYAVEAQFHEIAFAVPLLACSAVAYLNRRWWAAALWAAPLVFVKEDLGLTVFMLGLVIAWRSRRVVGLWLAVWGVAWFVLSTRLILPALNPDGDWAYGAKFDLLAVLADPGTAFAQEKWETLALLVVIGAAIALRSPLILVTLPTLAWRFLSESEIYWGQTWHYSAILMPIVFVAALEGMRFARASRRPWLRTYTNYVPTVMFMAALMLLPTLPLYTKIDANLPPVANPREECATAVVELIPRGAVVESDIGLMNFLVDGHDVYWLGNTNPAPEYLVLDRQGGGTPQEWGSPDKVAQDKHPGTSYNYIFECGGYQVAQRAGS